MYEISFKLNLRRLRAVHIRCTEYWMFLVCSSLFGLLTGAWVACETPLIIRTLR
jgi:hypothetical protein